MGPYRLIRELGRGGMGTAQIASRERARAEQRFDDVRRLANAYLFEVHDSIRDLPGSTPARQLLVTRGLEYLDKLAAEGQNRADLRREIANGYIRLGDVQGRPLNPNLGDTTNALASYQKALATFEALESARQGLEVLKAIDRDTAEDPAVRRELVVAHSAVGDLLSATGDTKGALEQRRISLTIIETLAALDPANLDNIRQLGVAYHKLGNSLGNPNYPNVGDYQGALENLERSASAESCRPAIPATSSRGSRSRWR